MSLNLPKMVHIVGVIAGFLAGVAGIVAVITTGQLAYGVWGAVFLISSTLAVVGGASASPRGGVSPPKAGAKYTRVPDWVTYVVMALFLVAIVVTFLVPPWG